jgi:hypothetical protein
MSNTTHLAAAAAKAGQPFQVSLVTAFDEIAGTFLKTSNGKAQDSLQSYLDGIVLIGGIPFTRRAILLAIHDMTEDVEAPLALQKRTLAELRMLGMWPSPQLRFYRDLATVFLRMEVIIRTRATRANGEAKH